MKKDKHKYYYNTYNGRSLTDELLNLICCRAPSEIRASQAHYLAHNVTWQIERYLNPDEHMPEYDCEGGG